MTQLTIFSVATDHYINYWIDLYNSAEQFLDDDLTVQWILFTNKPGDIPIKIREETGSNLLLIPIDVSPWPMPTLLRYELLSSVAQRVLGNIVMHLDADMLFTNSLSKDDLNKALAECNIALVRHPGFYRPSGFSKTKFYLRNPRYFFSDLKSLILFGGIGSWESNTDSLSFVPRKNRDVYVCGATWLGKKQAIIDLCLLLSERIRKDLAMNKIAKFHDESHLNWYAANNEVKLLSPKYCYEQTYPQLKLIIPIIIAVDKGKEFTRIGK